MEKLVHVVLQWLLMTGLLVISLFLLFRNNLELVENNQTLKAENEKLTKELDEAKSNWWFTLGGKNQLREELKEAGNETDEQKQLVFSKTELVEKLEKRIFDQAEHHSRAMSYFYEQKLSPPSNVIGARNTDSQSIGRWQWQRYLSIDIMR